MLPPAGAALEETQQKLEVGRVAIAGLGGLGSNIAVAPARIGVGHLHLLDFDRIDLTNLNRQQYFLDQVGWYKTEALAETLQRISPYLDIRFDTVKITEENIKKNCLRRMISSAKPLTSRNARPCW